MTYEYRTTVGSLEWIPVEKYPDPKSPDEDKFGVTDTDWELVSSCIGVFRQGKQPILWFWRRKV